MSRVIRQRLFPNARQQQQQQPYCFFTPKRTCLSMLLQRLRQGTTVIFANPRKDVYDRFTTQAGSMRIFTLDAPNSAVAWIHDNEYHLAIQYPDTPELEGRNAGKVILYTLPVNKKCSPEWARRPLRPYAHSLVPRMGGFPIAAIINCGTRWTKATYIKEYLHELWLPTEQEMALLLQSVETEFARLDYGLFMDTTLEPVDRVKE